MSTGGSNRFDARGLATLTNLHVDAIATEVASAMRSDEVPFLLLKGPSIARWLYADDEARSYCDVDLLVPPDAVQTAHRVLESLGMKTDLADVDLPGWDRASTAWRRHEWEPPVDLHRTLVGVGVAPGSLWSALWAEQTVLDVAGVEMPVTSVRARALHVALHAAQHGRDAAKPLADLERALEVCSDEGWRDSAVLAAELDAQGAFVAGLRLRPAGEAVIDRLGLEGRPSVETAILIRSPPPGVMGLEHLAGHSGLRARMRIALRKLVPTRAFMRSWTPLASRGPLLLPVAYVYRMLWVLGHAPRALIIWLRVRVAARRAA
jgi:hypothetical protein